MSNKKISVFTLVLFFMLFVSCSLMADVKMPAIFGDNMVLQKDKAINVWGFAEPTEKIIVEIAGQKVSVSADTNGKWSVKLNQINEIGPHKMTITGKNTITINNILMGEVWIGSGQSNMDVPVVDARNASEEINNANYPNIRLFTVPKKFANQLLSDVNGKWGKWVECSPETVKGFSAVLYFFGRELYKKLNVPIGLINSSWGGTPIESWMRVETFKSDTEFNPIIDGFEKVKEQVDWNLYQKKREEYKKQLSEWEKQLGFKGRGNEGFENGWAKPEYDSSTWNEIILPKLWKESGLSANGTVWFRNEVDIPESWDKKKIYIGLGNICDFDTVYLNGVEIAETGFDVSKSSTVKRKYLVPYYVVETGKNVIAIRVVNIDNKSGGFIGQPDEMKIFVEGAQEKTEILLAGKWKYKMERDYSVNPLSDKPVGPLAKIQNTPTVLYNAMIAPIVPFGIRGVIWYQGESNAWRAYQYRKLFPMMIKDWRKIWESDNFPFLFVQLANFKAKKPEPGESSWAELREAQLMTLSVENTGMAVIIDIGEEKDIHPKNKQDVGYRLALPALVKAYKKDNIVYSGPIYKSMKVEGNKIRLKFDFVGGGLVALNSNDLIGFTIAGEDKSFYWAKAVIDGDSVVVSNEKVLNPVAVRYAWQDNPDCNLYNKEGLPASPFRTDAWEGMTANNTYK